MQQSLNELYSQYTNGKLKRAELEGFIYKYLFFNQEKTCLSHWKYDEYEDYVSWFYSRLHKAIDSYSETGSSFEAFIGKFILTSSKEYRVRITTKNIFEYSAWSARVPELYLHEELPGYIYDNEDKILSKLLDNKNGRMNTRRILALILKCYYYVSEDFIDKITPKIGIKSDELRKMINKIQEIRQKKDNEIYNLKERIYCQYYRCMVYERRLMHFLEDPMAYNKLKLRLEKARVRLEKMRKRLKLIRKNATNRQVAQVIGIKKGTVDSSLYNLRARLDILADKSLLN